MKPYIIILLALLAAVPAMANNRSVIDNEQLLRQYLEQTQFSIDTAAQAVVLYEKGSSYLIDGKLSFKVERTIKVLGNDAIGDISTVTIPYNADDYVRKISGTTYNLENGKVVAQSVSRDDVLKDRIDKSITVTKFNLPAVKKGSIIHYTYIREHDDYYIPEWDFQGEYPKLCSEYEVAMPSFIVYDALERVNVNMVKAQKNKELETCEACYTDNSFGTTEARTWVRRNVPAFREEDFMSSSRNYSERVRIHVSAVTQNGITHHLYKDWNEFSTKYFFKDDNGCGQAFARNGFLDEQTQALIAGKTSDLDKARAIYSHVRDNYTYISGRSKYNSIKDVFAEKKGNRMGINLLLTAMLRKAGLNSSPVLLSTRNNERLNMLFPTPELINYTASQVTINRQQYFMDASEKALPFGILPPECYNGYCRIVDEKGGSATLEPDSLLNKSTIIASLTPYEKDKSKLRLKIQRQMGVINGIAYRKAWLQDSVKVQRELCKGMEKDTKQTTQTSCRIKNMDRPDEKLMIEYEALVDFNREAGTLYIDPYFVKFYSSNPFKANDAADFEQYQEMYRTINAEKENLNIVLLNKTS